MEINHFAMMCFPTIILVHCSHIWPEIAQHSYLSEAGYYIQVETGFSQGPSVWSCSGSNIVIISLIYHGDQNKLKEFQI